MTGLTTYFPEEEDDNTGGKPQNEDNSDPCPCATRRRADAKITDKIRRRPFWRRAKGSLLTIVDHGNSHAKRYNEKKMTRTLCLKGATITSNWRKFGTDTHIHTQKKNDEMIPPPFYRYK